MSQQLVCPDCNKVCKTKSALKIHQKSHADMHVVSNELNQVINSKDKSIEQLILENNNLQVENNKLKLEIERLNKSIVQVYTDLGKIISK